MSFDFYFSSMPFSGNVVNYLMENHGCILLSQLNERSTLLRWVERFKSIQDVPVKIFVDSGSFSAWTKGISIDVDDYIDFINTNKDYFEICAAVDSIPGKHTSNSVATNEEVIKSCQDTWDNFLYMRSKMLDVNKLLYTFHIGEPWEYLKQALEYEDEHGKLSYIALGGMVGKERPLINKFLEEATAIIKNSSNPNVKVHAFGVGVPLILEKYKLTSSDSTTWCKVAGYGNIIYKNKTIEISNKNLLRDTNILSKSPAALEGLLTEIKNRGFTLQELQEDYDVRRLFNVITYHEWSKQYKYTPQIGKKISLF